MTVPVPGDLVQVGALTVEVWQVYWRTGWQMEITTTDGLLIHAGTEFVHLAPPPPEQGAAA